jgi:RND superfamily putative drug exporter
MLPTSKLDPAYRRALAEIQTAQTALTGVDAGVASNQSGAEASAASVDGATGQLNKLEAELAALHRGALRLAGGLQRLQGGVSTLTAGLDRLGDGGRRLAAGLQQLAGGSQRLSSGLARLDAGTGSLADGLSGGLHTATPIAASAQQLRGTVSSETLRLRSLTRDTAGSAALGRVAHSGLLVLAAIDTAHGGRRMAASFVVNVDGGGNAASITIVGQGRQTRAGAPLRAAIEAAAARLAVATSGHAYVGGPAATLQDFDSSTASRFPLLIAALALVTTLVMTLLLGSLVLATLAVALNLITTGAALGVLVLVFEGSQPLGGGPGWLDAVSVIGVFAVMFALSIDYEVFLLARMREAYRETGTLDGAIDAGLIGTAPVVIGAAAVMAAVFLLFATTDMDNIKELGIGLSAAIILDSTLIRLVLLPTCIRLLGDRCFESKARRRELIPAALSSPAA